MNHPLDDWQIIEAVVIICPRDGVDQPLRTFLCD